jgi:7,8-dihydropterin-6-yl-methyl-4-(beta-D-ribofuranosyl)aminobenzene 5'-phosphate synthase
MRRREFVIGSAALAGTAAAGVLPFPKRALAARIEVPVVDKLTMRVLIDSTHDVFLRPVQVNGVSHQPTGLLRGRNLPRVAS